MLAYVFWHRPHPDVGLGAYEDAQRAFHSSLETTSASFRLAELPFGDGGSGYEDWYLVENWEGLGNLNRTAVDPARRPGHDLAASQSADGWGAIYSPVRGPVSIPDGADWLHNARWCWALLPSFVQPSPPQTAGRGSGRASLEFRTGAWRSPCRRGRRGTARPRL